ncbi:MAG: glycoside hydrolase family 57 [bacterium]
MPNCLLLYVIFHLNLAYSSIEEEEQPEVLKRCYWPLLRLARTYNLPFGIEASGYTLEAAARHDPAWLDELRRLMADGPLELIGSGYSQVIGPLVPPLVNAANLALGHLTYERLLSMRPHIALVNEQAYSAGLVGHYLNAGYKAIIMEWDNPASSHPEWNAKWRYLPQIACDQSGREIPLIWNKSIAFQKFQRYAHAEIELEEYLDYLNRHMTEQPRAFPLYGNDVEIFDFRPGRYHTEAPLGQESDWLRIERLFEYLLTDSRFRFVRPGEVLELIHQSGAGNRLHLESPEQPVPVKKQGKYNITRWAVTGRNDLGINTACWRIYEALKANCPASAGVVAGVVADASAGVAADAGAGVAAGAGMATGTDMVVDAGLSPGSVWPNDDWRDLCFLWSSDFRTHITEKRWAGYLEYLAAFENRAKGISPDPPAPLSFGQQSFCHSPSPHFTIERRGRYLSVETNALRLRLNTRRGLAFDGLWFKEISDKPLIGTLPHGYYDDIALGADFYTGHLVLESFGQPKVTDLNPVEPAVENTGSWIDITGAVPTPLGPVCKRVRVFHISPRVELEYKLDWEAMPPGSLRAGHITLNPAAFERSTLFYRTHNGGHEWERFTLSGYPAGFQPGIPSGHQSGQGFDHGKSVSFLVSASQGLGLTSGVVELGDEQRSIRIEVDKTAAALIGLITYRPVGDTCFYRLSLSAGEMDETRRMDRASSADRSAHGVSYVMRIAVAPCPFFAAG